MRTRIGGSMKNTELQGVIVPIITPVDRDDRVDESALRKAIRHVIDGGVHGLFVGGSAGEGPLLTEKEWTRMMEIALDENQNKVSLLGGVMDTSTEKVKEKVKLLKQIGYGFFVVCPTFYISLGTPEEHHRLFSECAKIEGGMEMVAYNIPQNTHSQVPVEVLREFVRRGWIRYCKDSSGDREYFKRLLAAGLKVLSGSEVDLADKLLAGAVGVVNVCANYEPATYVRAYYASLNKDREELAKMQERVKFLHRNLCLGGPCWLSGVKYAMSTLGVGSGKPVSPLQPAPEEQRKIIDEITRKKGI
jgi:dihydrodipicolinate synthase/N-acetylneuraminate lyase